MLDLKAIFDIAERPLAIPLATPAHNKPAHNAADTVKLAAVDPMALAIMPVHIYAQLEQQGLAMKIIFEDTQYIVVSKP